ncbi:hypothetical protein [Halorubrum halodurans]|uniref:Uncharacterized protein n=1 Tax=Halorubrum halodurans TaxID=1383851 RepID=A0A256IIT6_9EURY|nr:hypothetical protein [Halorubrum halodurans]OYR56471.1 hypothetical protein DJ70_08520 [Halorubrum halodurans]
MGTTAVETVCALCKRYGPGRLPGAGRPAVGAGYAVATAALAAAMAFVVLTGIQTLLFGGPIAVTGELTYVGLLAIPLVVPAAFAGGVVAWRLLPESISYRGPLASLLATVLTCVFATLLVVPLLIASSPTQPRASVELGLLVGIVGFLTTFWLTLPIGAVSGWIHERAVTEH